MQATAQYTSGQAGADDDRLPPPVPRYTLNGREIDDDTFGTLVRELEGSVSLLSRTSMRRCLDFHQEYALCLGLYHWSLSGETAHMRGWAQVTDHRLLQNFIDRLPRETSLEFSDEFEDEVAALWMRAATEVRRG